MIDLQNGATAFAHTMVYDESCQGNAHGVVLAQVREDEFATWVVDGDGNCSNGHYYGKLSEAIEDYTERRKSVPPAPYWRTREGRQV